MKLKLLLILMLAAVTFSAYAQEGGIRGRVVSRNGSEALSNVNVTIGSTGLTAITDKDGNFVFENLPSGNYSVSFDAPEFEHLDILVRVGKMMNDLNSVTIIPTSTRASAVDDAVFAEFDSDSSSSDVQALPSSLSASKDLFNSIASYRFSEMRFNNRGYDSKYSDIYLNGIRFNDAMTGYGPWSLWSGLNDATRNQESVAGLNMTDYGLGGIGGVTNVNARASQMRKGFRASVANGNQMYRLRVMLSYASGQLDNGWSYAFSVGTRQGGNGYVDGVYYNSYSYFASAEKLFGENHRLAFTFFASPSERGAQQAATDEVYALFGNNYYNPNVGYWAGKLRNSRVRNTHEPIAMFNYTWDISDRTRLTAATALRFGKNGYSALTWNGGADPRPDYYRLLPSYPLQLAPTIKNEVLQGDESTFIPGAGLYFASLRGQGNAFGWTPWINFDNLYNENTRNIDPKQEELVGNVPRSNTILEERRTDQLDYNFAANVAHNIRENMRIIGGVNLRVNRTSYFDVIKDLMGGNYWLDIDKFADRDVADSPELAQNDLDYYIANGHAPIARKGDKFNYNYRAHLLETSAWARYTYGIGGFSMGLGGEVGYSSMHREGLWRKGLFANNSKGDSEKLNYLTYNVKGNFGYRFSGAHALELNVTYMQDAPKFASAFVSPRTRNTVTPGLSAQQTLGAELTYNLNLPYIKARVSGYYSTISNEAKVISFYDDTRNSFTNFAMSGIDKRYYGVELGLNIPVWNGIAVVGAISWGDYTYTSNPEFTQTVDNINAQIGEPARVNWKGFHVESTPQMAFNIGLDYRGPHNWFAAINFNYYNNLYLSMNPFFRTDQAVEYYTNANKYYGGVIISPESSDGQIEAAYKEIALNNKGIKDIRRQEKFKAAYTLSLSVGKNWYINRKYMIGANIEVKNLLNNQDIRTGGYEQMRMNKIRVPKLNDDIKNTLYTRFDSKYFYMLGTTYYLNVYFRF